MRLTTRAAALFAAMGFAATAAIAQSPPAATPAPATPAVIEKLPASAFARLPFVEDVSLSPNGQYMAGMFEASGQQLLAMMPAVGDKSKQKVLAVPEKVQVTAIRWVGNDHVIARLSMLLPVEGNDWYVTRYMAVERATGKVTRLLWDMAGQSAELLWTAKDGSPEVLIAAQNSIYVDDEGFWPSVFRVDVATGRSRLVERGRTNVMDWGADQHGRVRYAITYNDVTTRSRFLYRSESGGTFKTIGNVDLREDEALPDPITFIAGGDRAIVIGTSDKGHATLEEMDLLSGAVTSTLFDDANVKITGTWLARDGNSIIGVLTPDPAKPIHWIEPKMQAAQVQISAASPKSTTEILSASTDQTKMLVHFGTPDNPGLLFHFDAATQALTQLGAMNQSIGGKRLSRAKLITYKARDGLEIEAVLTLPRGRAAKALPFVVMPHGGPWAQDMLTYDYWAQYLAELGYGVIQPNFRGSTGYGQDFMDKGHGQMGLAMQDDLNDAMAWTVAEGMADSKRACIAGASYGGYAAMWGAARDPDLYRCAISIAGVSNLRKEVSDFGGSTREKLYRSQWGKMSADFAAVSPINFVDRIKVPMLLIHGKKDVTVDVGQSDRMHAAMRRAGKTVEYLALPLADHYFTREADRLALLESMGAFLKQHNPPD